MTEWADDAALHGLDEWRGGGRMPFWPSEAQAGKPLHPMYSHRPRTCRQCGYGFLFWQKQGGSWRLHHYAVLPGEEQPRFVLHRCGFDSAGNPKPPEQSQHLTQPKGERDNV